MGNVIVATAGDIEVKADENTYLSAEALSIAASFSLGAAVGASVVNNIADSDIEATITNADVTTFGNVDVIANSDLNINNTDTAGISGSLVGVTVNSANAVAKNTVKAGIHAAQIHAETGAVSVKAITDNDAEAQAVGGAVGALAVGAMLADTTLGTAAEEEVVAEIGDNTVIHSASLMLSSDSDDDIFAEGQALSGGLVGIAGADVDTETRQDVIARIGNNVEIHTGELDIMAEHNQSVDARGDALAFGLGAGTGVDVDNLILGQAVVDIGQNSELFASNIFIDAKNVVSKERFNTGFNLSSGSVGLVSFGIMSSTTDIGTGSQSFDARVDIGSGTLLQVDTPEGVETPVIGAESRNAPRIEIETYINAKGVDNVRVEAVSGLVGGAKGKSIMDAELNSQVNITDATIINNDGDVFFTTRTDTLLRPNANLTVVSGLTGGGLADVSTVTNALNNVNLTNSTIRGSDISLFAGEDSIRVPNIMFSFADAQIFTASLLPSISIPSVVATLNEANIVNVSGNSLIEATSDINLYATQGIGGGDRAATTGSVLSLSLIPYGVDVPDRATVTSTNQVNIDANAFLEAGINNQAPYYILPINTVSGQPGIDLPAGVSLADLETGGVLLTDAQKIEFGLVDDVGNPLVADLEFEAINLEKVGFFVDNGTVIEDGGNFYIVDPDFLLSDDSINLVLQDEDYSDTDRWNQITINYDLSVNATPTVSNGQIVRTADDDTAYTFVGTGPYSVASNEDFNDISNWAIIGQIYASNVTDSLQLDLQGKFYVIKPVEIAAPVLTYVNIGSLLIKQLEQVEDWIANHVGDNEAIARYNIQREDILATMTDLGLTVDDGGTISPVRELDTVLFDVPDILSSAGSVFVNVDNASTQGQIQTLVDSGRVVSNAGARIDVLNRTPISMSVNDAIIEDNRRIEAIGGSLVVFTPGNVYVNGNDLTGAADESAQDITILQDALLNSEYDFGALTLPDVPQDLFIAGDVINENGNVDISNREGSINVSGTIRGEQVDIASAKNFSLNTEGWLHTNQDPRQYIDYTLTRNTVFEEGKVPGTAPNSLSYLDTNSVAGFGEIYVPGATITIFGITIVLPGSTELGPVDPQLDEAIARNESRILAQGRITITAKFLNINGLIQSGTDNIGVDIAASFVPPSQTAALADAFNNALPGITFGDGIPVDGYWDAANQRIVIEEIVPQGGEIILAGQIISTGNGILRVANGFTDVNINNESNFDLYIERIDVTTDKEGKIQITDTSTGDGTVANPFERMEYTLNSDQVEAQLYHGVVLPPNPDGLSIVDYTKVGTPGSQTIGGGVEFNYSPVDGTQYFWVEGQEKTQTEVRYYKKNTFNLFGGGTWFEDALVGDDSYRWRTFEFTDEKPLLESEGIIIDSSTSDVAYSVDYKTTETAAPVTTIDNWTTGGGWLRKKSYHKLVTTVSGVKDFYTHTLEADVPIAIDFIDGPSAPAVSIRSAGSIDFGEINVPDTVASSVSITTTGAGANILQDISSGIFGTNDVTIDSAGSLRANIEGLKEPAAFAGFAPLALDAPTVTGEVGAFKASGDIWIGFFETEAGQVGTQSSDRKVVVDYIWSTDGNVFVSAPDGIFAKDNNSFIIGNQVELYAKEGQIGTVDNPIFIDSDAHGEIGDGGVLAWAQGDINIREMEGDLYLSQQLDLASGFDEGNTEQGLSNLQSTYDEIRPLEDGANNTFEGSIHSTTGAINIEVVAGSVIDAIEEGFVQLTPEEIEARNARLGLTGAAGEAAALAELDADANAKTEAYHRYWKDFRGATNVLLDGSGEPIPDAFGQVQFTTPIATLDVDSVNAGTEILTFASNHGLETGDEVFANGIVEAGDTNLREGAAYYVIKVSDTEIQLASTRSDAAIDENPLDIINLGVSLAALQLLRYDYTEDAFTPGLVIPNSQVINGPQSVQDAYDAGDTLFGSQDEYDPDFVFTYSQAEKDAFVEANTFSLAALENPVSPGLMKALYPHAEFSNGVVNSDSTEFANITGDEVFIVAGTRTDSSGNVIVGEEGSIGSKSDLITIDNPIDFESISDEGKIAMANASQDDIVGVHYRIYEYTGSNQLDIDLRGEDFSTGSWTEIVTDYVTGTDATASINQNVLVGQTVLVQLDSGSFGLYRATQAFNGNIANKDIYLGSGWERLTDDGGSRADHDTDSGPVDLLTGDIVLDKFNVQTLTLQLFDDIDIEAQDDRAINLGANAGGEIIIQTSDNLKIHHVLAGADVRLQATSASTVYPDDTDPGGSITGDGTVAGDSADPANDIAIGTLGNLTLLADNSIGTADSPLRIQIAPTGSLSMNVTGQLYLHQIAGTTLDIDYTDTTPDTTAFNPADRGFSVTLAEVAQLGYVDSLTSMHLPELIKIDAATVDINDLTVENASAGGDLSIRIVDETGASDTGNLIIGKIAAGSTVDLRAPESILDLFDDAAAPIVNILTDAMSSPGDVYLEAGTDIGSITNFIDVEIWDGELNGLVENNAFIHSVRDLNVGYVPGFTSSNGNVTLLVDGQTNVGLITARNGTVKITAEDAIVDRRDDAVANIVSRNVDLYSQTSTIGDAANPLDIDTSFFVTGFVDADAEQTVYLIETFGTMHAGIITSRNDDVTLETLSGSILDYHNDTANNISAININLIARGGDIGEEFDALEIDSSNPSQGWLNASAINSDIDIAETDGPLYVGTVFSGSGDIRLSVRDSADSDEALIMDSNASIDAPLGSVLLRVGDDVDIQQGASINALNSITIRGDVDDLEQADADPGVGVDMTIFGDLAAEDIFIHGRGDVDNILFTPETLSGWTRIFGGAEDDFIVLDELPNLDLVNKFNGTPATSTLVTGRNGGERDTVDVDGQGGTDRTTIFTTGITDYIVNVTDSGAPDDGADRLTIEGTAGDDSFLLRRDFVAKLQQTGVDTDGNPVYGSNYERINYTESINGRLTVEGLEGKDRFYSDNNSSITTLDGGSGDDFFQFGQVFGADRVSTDTAGAGETERVSAGDEIETIQTTLGFLSRGISFPTTVYGGDGDDEFSVYSNKALLKLFGEDGNDEFVVRAFLIEGTDELSSTDTEVNGGTGDDNIQYNINAPVSIDGGAGADTVVIIGTEASDNFVITKDGVQGAGLNVDFSLVEKLEVDGMEGDDHFYVLSTSQNLVTTIIGGLGSDTIDVAGDVTDDIVALSIEGRSGFINHSLASADVDFNSVFAEGIQLNVADGATGTLIVDESGGNTLLVEDSAVDDTYTLRLAVPPPMTTTRAYVTVSAALAGFKDRSIFGKSVEVSSDGINYYEALVVTFDSDPGASVGTAWDRTQTIHVRAVSDTAEEGERTVVISHSMFSDDPAFDNLNIPNVDVKLIDNDKPALVIKESGTGTEVLEGASPTDNYTIALTRAPDAGETVTVTLTVDDSQVSLTGGSSRFTATATAGVYELTFNDANWNSDFSVDVTGTDDSDPENSLLRTIEHTISSSGGTTPVYATALDKHEVEVNVRDNDAGGLIVTPSDGSTLVSEGVHDTYDLQLTKAPTAPVTVSILSDGKTLVSADSDPLMRFDGSAEIPTVTFDASNWNIPFTVRVEVNPDAEASTEQPIQVFPAQPHNTSQIAGPLIVEGSLIPGKDRSINPAVMLDSETDIPLPVLDIEVDETTQTDILNIYNDGSLTNDTGVHRIADSIAQSGLEAVYEVGVGELSLSEFGHINGLQMGAGLSSTLTVDFGTGSTPDLREFERGITYHGLEVVDILLGQGDDMFTVEATVQTEQRNVANGEPTGVIEGTITVVQGGGGDDTIIVTGGGGEIAPLVVLGDTTQDGAFYNSTTAELTDYLNGVSTILPLAREFTNPGNDTIDASASSDFLTIYGGAGNDTIHGSTTGDHIAGGSGADTIHGEGGDDHIYGDAGFNLDLTQRLEQATLAENQVLLVVNNDTATEPTRDGLAPANDIIMGDAGSDIIFGDYGFITQAHFTQRISTVGNVELIDSVNPASGGADIINGNQGVDRILGGYGEDTIHGDEDGDIILGDSGIFDYAADGDLATLDEVYTTEPGIGSNDTLFGDGANDLLIGGAADDTIFGNTGNDIIFGDNARALYAGGILSFAESIDPAIGGVDTIEGNENDDLIIGGADADIIFGNDGDDIALGDNAEIQFGSIQRVETTARTIGGADLIRGNAGQDLLVGGAFGDRIDGNADEDLIFGDNVRLDRATGSSTNPRYRVLSGVEIYDSGVGTGSADQALVTDAEQAVPGGAAVWEDFDIIILDHSDADQSAGLSNFGDDYIAGGAHDDQIFAQLGNDIIQGDGSIDLAVDVNAYRDATNTLVVSASIEDFASIGADGDDYIEGNGGDDVIFGNLGQDDIIGGSSELFSLITEVARPDGSDLIFGGAGTDIERNNPGAGIHGRDSDMILGDNGNIFRLLNAGATPLSFNYDDGYGEQIVVRAAELLDYTAGGPDWDPGLIDNGNADEVHGESGDDFIYGMTGNDILFGEGEDDNLIGGWGHDWLSGGTGQDGVLGDDGRIFTSRNGTAEPLYGIVASIQESISTPGNIQQASINVTGELKKSVDLTPFNPVAGGTELADAQYADDIIYGGLGGDWLHGGSGDDAMSGAEALPQYYDKPFNPGNVLRYSLVTGEFAEYDEFEPLIEIVYSTDAPPGYAVGAPFLLNFDHTEGPVLSSETWGDVNSDGDDKIFGDLGNDWLVGGSGRDNLYGGWGNDLLNADDDHSTNAGLNDAPDTHPSYEDRAYGGAGRDRLIANTGGDRLIDWAGEFDSYIVPFAPFGMGTVSRTLQPQLQDFLYALSASDGADFTRGGDLARNGEPDGELGLVKQQDFAWKDQTGAPDDPQPGNIPGGARDVLRSASFDDPSMTGFFADSGLWQVSDGALQVSAESLNGDAVSVFHVGDQLPGYFELQASIMMEKATAGWNANAYLIFDYQNEQDFKFVGIDDSINKLVMGHRDASGWHVDEQGVVLGGVKPDQWYNMLVAINGVSVTLVVNNQHVFSHTYEPKIIDGYAFGLNYGYVGVGSDNARGSFDNIRVQILPPEITFENTEDFEDGVADLHTGGSVGVWNVDGGRYSVDPSGDTAISLIDLGPDHLNFNSVLELGATVNTQGRAGVIFDRYGDESFKFAAIDAANDQLIIGHYTAKRGWVEDAVVSTTIDAGVDYSLGVTLKGATVSANLSAAGNGGLQAIVSHVFNAATVDGNFGLLAMNGSTAFDDVIVRTNDPAFITSEPAATLLAATTADSSSTELLTTQALDPIIEEAVRRWSWWASEDTVRQTLAGVNFAIADLGGQVLGLTDGNTIVLDDNAAGHGWFIDSTPMDDSEYHRLQNSSLSARPFSEAAEGIDLLSVAMHEIGHLLGYSHEEDGVMDATLALGERYMLDPMPTEKPHRHARPLTPPTIDWESQAQPAKKMSKGARWVENFVTELAAEEIEDPNSAIEIFLDD